MYFESNKSFMYFQQFCLKKISSCIIDIVNFQDSLIRKNAGELERERQRDMKIKRYEEIKNRQIIKNEITHGVRTNWRSRRKMTKTC